MNEATKATYDDPPNCPPSTNTSAREIYEILGGTAQGAGKCTRSDGGRGDEVMLRMGGSDEGGGCLAHTVYQGH